jgi:hypothetical protein
VPLGEYLRIVTESLGAPPHRFPLIVGRVLFDELARYFPLAADVKPPL